MSPRTSTSPQKTFTSVSMSQTAPETHKVIILVKDVPPTIGQTQFEGLFSQYGKLLNYSEHQPSRLSASPISPPTSKSKYVLLQILAKPKTLKKITPQVVIKNKVMRVSIIEGKPEKRFSRNRNHKIFIGNLPPKKIISNYELACIFIKFGPIKHVYPVINLATRQCKGYGFVEFQHESSARLAVQEEVGGLILQGRILTCEFKERNRKKVSNSRPQLTVTTTTNSFKQVHNKPIKIGESELNLGQQGEEVKEYHHQKKNSSELSSQSTQVEIINNKSETITFRFGPPLDCPPKSHVELDSWSYYFSPTVYDN